MDRALVFGLATESREKAVSPFKPPSSSVDKSKSIYVDKVTFKREGEAIIWTIRKLRKARNGDSCCCPEKCRQFSLNQMTFPQTPSFFSART